MTLYTITCILLSKLTCGIKSKERAFIASYLKEHTKFFSQITVRYKFTATRWRIRHNIMLLWFVKIYEHNLKKLQVEHKRMESNKDQFWFRCYLLCSSTTVHVLYNVSSQSCYRICCWQLVLIGCLGHWPSYQVDTR